MELLTDNDIFTITEVEIMPDEVSIGDSTEDMAEEFAGGSNRRSIERSTLVSYDKISEVTEEHADSMSRCISDFIRSDVWRKDESDAKYLETEDLEEVAACYAFGNHSLLKLSDENISDNFEGIEERCNEEHGRVVESRENRETEQGGCLMEGMTPSLADGENFQAYVEIDSDRIIQFIELQDIDGDVEINLATSTNEGVDEDNLGSGVALNQIVYQCKPCSAIFLTLEIAKSHMEMVHSHSSDGLFSTRPICFLCSIDFQDLPRLSRHLKDYHIANHDNRILNRKRKSRKSRRLSHIDCIICHAKLHTISSYSYHVRHFHRQISLYSVAVGHVLHLRSAGQEFVLALQCPLCEIVDSGWFIISHLMENHSTEEDLENILIKTESSLRDASESFSTSGDLVMEIPCSFCQTFVRKNSFVTHFEFFCEASPMNRSSLTSEAVMLLDKDDIVEERVQPNGTFLPSRHEEHSMKTLVCKFKNCNSTFLDETELQIHSSWHDSDQLTVCLICRRSYPTQAIYADHHDKVHRRRFRHTCSVCSRDFWKKSDKLTHQCRPQDRIINQIRKAQRAARAKRVLDKWKGNFSVQAPRGKVDEMLMPEGRKRKPDEDAASKPHQTNKQNSDSQRLVCMICQKSFKSVRYFQSHFRHTHLHQYDLVCNDCGRGFWNRRQYELHKCNPNNRIICEVKRKVLAKRALQVLKNYSKPYYCLVGNDDCSGTYRLDTALPDMIDGAGIFEEETREHFVFDPFSQNMMLLSDILKSKKEMMSQGVTDDVSMSSDKQGFSSMSTDCSRIERDRSIDRSVDHFKKAKQMDSPPVQVDREVHENNDSTERIEVVKHEANEMVDQNREVKSGYCICNVCGKELKEKNVNPHMRRVHRDDKNKPIEWKICDTCGYKCQDNYKLRRHKMTHDRRDAKAIPCELCSYLSYEMMDYNQHFKRKHLGRFSIRCESCGKGFWKTIALQNHPCFPELKEENLQMQREKEDLALRKRDEIRAIRGVGTATAPKMENATEKNLMRSVIF